MRKLTGKLHHVEINVSNLKRSKKFWKWILECFGYELFQQWENGASWKLGDTYIVFVQTVMKHKKAGFNRCRTGLNHLAFHVASREQVDRVTAELRRRKVTILYPDTHPFAGGKEYYAVFFEDPDRIKVEVVAPRRKPESD